ncbi:MAG: hypothetical protein HQL11_04475, partial [Candidatus Omnitrophica bacterium]|nr:hypothetical protein [Candidatus Omnitrophota bacterium]
MSTAPSQDASRNLLDAWTRTAEETTPFFAGVWTKQLRLFGESWASSFARDLHTLFGAEDDESIQKALSGYAAFAADSIRSQKFFEKHQRY